jgi:peptidoglycan/LPS O-acetylase OafA/YrhL
LNENAGKVNSRFAIDSAHKPNRLQSIEEVSAEKHLNRRIPSLDGLRAISIVFVLFSHIGADVYFSSEAPAGMMLTSLGIFGVKIFFIISGYLITLLLLQENNRLGHVNLYHFYVRRAFRILPAAYVYMILCFVASEGTLSFANKVLALFFLENYSLHPQWNLGHLWSLGVEEQFYCLWPICFIWFSKTRKAMLLAVICVVPVINVAIIYFRLPYWNAAFYSVADTLAVGCLMALVRDKWYVDQALERNWFACISFFLLLTLPLNVIPGGTGFGLIKSLLIRPGMNIAIALTIEQAVRCAPIFLNTSWISTIGVMSYSIYLWQQPLTRSSLFPTSRFIDIPVRLLCISACALCSYYLIERPFLQLRKRLFLQH